MPTPLHAPDVTASERVHVHRDAPLDAAGPVVLWLRQAHRADDNPALEHALALAGRWQRPLVVLSVLDPAEPGLTVRTAVFALQGLVDLRDALRTRRVGLQVRCGDSVDVVVAATLGAAALVCDRGYLRHQRERLARVAERVRCAVVEVEGEAIVPVETASDKAEYAARTLRPKLWRALEHYRALPVRVATQVPSDAAPPLPGAAPELVDTLDGVDDVLERLAPDHAAGSVTDWFVGGARAAQAALERFVRSALPGYEDGRSQPQRDAVSFLGMYLRHGHVSPQRVLDVLTRHAEAGDAVSGAVDGFVEQLLVRRELAINHAWYVPDYDRYDVLPQWARDTLAKHAGDPREALYDDAALEAGETHDPYWNAAMREMRETGYMHNVMRMYWGKRILAWSADPEAAFERTLRLNDRYFLDGRDPNSYAGVAWVYGRHDRPWPERAVFGTVRSMVAAGLERKSDPRAYVAKVDRRVAARRLLLDEPAA